MPPNSKLQSTLKKLNCVLVLKSWNILYEGMNIALKLGRHFQKHFQMAKNSLKQELQKYIQSNILSLII